MNRSFMLPLAVAFGVAAPTWSAAPATAATDCPDAGLEYLSGKNLEDRARAAVLCLTNVERTGRGLPALTANAELQTAAQWHASDMARLPFYSHYAPAAAGHGVEFSERARRAGYLAVEGYSGPILAENIYQSPTTPYKVVAGFMKSTGHCQNILDERLKELGVGVSYGRPTTGGSREPWPYWTQLFGNRDPASVPEWPSNPGRDACPHTALIHSAPASAETPATGTPKAPTGTASIVTVGGQKRVAVTGSAPGLKTVRVTSGRERTVRGRVVFTPGPSVLVRVKPATQTYKAVVRTPPATTKGRPVIRVSNTKANVSRRIPIRTR